MDLADDRQRRDRRGRRRGARAAWRVMLATAICVALFDFLRSDYFLVKQVNISGLVRLTPAEVQAQGELDRQQLVWQVWPWRTERLLARHPRVAAARVQVRLPNRVKILVTERQPVAFVLYQGSRYLEVDKEGRVLALWDYLPSLALPVITGVAAKETKVGDRLADPRLGVALLAAAGLGAAGRAETSELHVDGDGELVLYTMGGLPVYMGAEEGVDGKIATFLGIYGSLAAPAAVEYIDLRSPRRPAVKMKGAPVGAAPAEHPRPPDRLSIP